ncbi:MAG: hypothetical protein P8076_01810 [Gammaproteobacteria bacterium]
MTFEWEKFHLAMHTLAGAGSIQRRLADAYTLHLMHVAPAELPAEVRPLFEHLRAELTGGSLEANSGDICDRVRRLSDDQASEAVDRILVIHDAVARSGATFA